MRTRWIALLLALSVSTAGATQWTYLANVPAITITNSAGGIGITTSYLSGDGHARATVGTCVVSVAQLRYTVDGTAPTSSYGYLVEIGGQIALNGAAVLSSFRAIRTGSTSAVIDCVVGTP